MIRDPGPAWAPLFSRFDRAQGQLKAQIRHALVQALDAGVLQPGTRLPSGRQLAALLDVARITIVEVYQQLVDQGYLVARERSGIFVAPPVASLPAPIPAADGGDEGWEQRFAIRPGRAVNLYKPHDWQRYRYPFLFGELDPALFPAAEWRDAVKVASSKGAIQSWSVDMIDADDRLLIEQLCQNVLPRRAIWAAPEEVMVTLGAQQALYFLLRLFAGPGTVVGVEDPGYPDSRRMAQLQTRHLRHIAVDAEGAVPDAAFAACDLVLLTPGHHSPTSVVMSPGRRREVMHLARARGIILVEDDYDADLFAEGAPMPPLRATDPERRVIHVGSFSKTLSPGLRLGFVVAPRPVISELRALRRLSMRHPPSNNQRAMASFIALGHYRSHLRRVDAALAQRAQLMDRLLPQHLAGCRWQRGAGASSVWVTGPDTLDARRLAEAARHHGVLMEPGEAFFAEPGQGRNSFRLGFSSLATERIEDGLARLAAAGPFAPELSPTCAMRQQETPQPLQTAAE
ncbi:aminotransferase-like domain-containing protein [Plastoroseomonas hellenica]|uniref:aminotransferase-like domain-containing protein n=1 Tax=Plastoroseomonas hellenica TaxID=2687306 RepID=UPI001BAE4EE6|nr:PLP-dependent aminotransferase family protein [Plastoroseomonas hellenica]MBR0641537.1 PLP-dependent aminotransferase family protein [Plastoroseomonas hellenica]